MGTYFSGAYDLLLTKLLVEPGYGQCPTHAEVEHFGPR